MPPVTVANAMREAPTHRVVVYHQTHHGQNNGAPISILPLIGKDTGVTHVVVAALHLNDPAGNITLNDHPPSHERFQTLWNEVKWCQGKGVKVLGMLGGAAQGSYKRLDGSEADFERYYLPLKDVIKHHQLDGLDLDVEEEMSISGVMRLINRLRDDFGPDFLITLAPVSSALVPNRKHISGFNYFVLEFLMGHEIAWYNTQFYCGWAMANSTARYDDIITAGWKPEKVVMGMLTSPVHGPGHVSWPRQENVLQALRLRYPGFGGVMGWEYSGSLPGGVGAPWQWAEIMARTLNAPISPLPAHDFPGDWIKALEEEGKKLTVQLGFIPWDEQQIIAALYLKGGDLQDTRQRLVEVAYWKKSCMDSLDAIFSN